MSGPVDQPVSSDTCQSKDFEGISDLSSLSFLKCYPTMTKAVFIRLSQAIEKEKAAPCCTRSSPQFPNHHTENVTGLHPTLQRYPLHVHCLKLVSSRQGLRMWISMNRMPSIIHSNKSASESFKYPWILALATNHLFINCHKAEVCSQRWMMAHSKAKEV